MEKFRVGPGGRTLYRQLGEQPSDADELIGMLDTPRLAAFAVVAMNAAQTFAEALWVADDKPLAPAPLPSAPEPLAVEAAQARPKLRCPRCHREISTRPGGRFLNSHHDKAHGGKPCGGQIGEQPTSRVEQSKRRVYRTIPDDLFELLAQHDNSPSALAKTLGIPAHTVQSWKARALAKQTRREQLAALPLHDPEEGAA